MHTIPSDDRTLTELDFVRLRKIGRGKIPDALSEALRSSDLVPSADVPADVVTMRSSVEIVHAGTGERQRFTVCYPWEANAALGLVSVLSPIGMSVLGMKAGASVSWRAQPGRTGRARIERVLDQPEAAGDFLS